MSEAISGVGTSIQYYDGAEFIPISEVNGINGPGTNKDTIDVTSLDSQEGYREFVPGFKAAGTVTLNLNFTRQNYNLFKEFFESSTLTVFKIDFSEGTAFSFKAFCTELPLTIPSDDKITMDVTLLLSEEFNVGSHDSLPYILPFVLT